MEFLVYPPAFLLAVVILVTVHEFGHYLVARASGVRILCFSIGVGKPLLRWVDSRGTAFVLAAIPIGGYVRMLDEDNIPADEVAAEPAQDSFQQLNPWWRVAIAAAGPAANVVLAVILFGSVALLGVSWATPYTNSPEPGSVAAQAGLPGGVRIVGIDEQPVEHWGDVVGGLIRRLGEDGQIRVTWRRHDDTTNSETDLPISDWLASEAEPDIIHDLGIRPAPIVVGRVTAGGPADAAGLQPGDVVVGTNGSPMNTWSEWVGTVQQHPGQTLQIDVLRNGDPITIAAVPGVVESDDGQQIGRLGVWAMVHTVSAGPLDALRFGLDQTWEHTALIFVHIGKMFTGDVSPRTVGGPLAIAEFAGNSLLAGAQSFLRLLAVLSISIAVLNILPIPVLDGGHILFALWEVVTGSRPPERVQTVGLQIGFVLVGALLLLSVSNDFLRLL